MAAPKVISRPVVSGVSSSRSSSIDALRQAAGIGHRAGLGESHRLTHLGLQLRAPAVDLLRADGLAGQQPLLQPRDGIERLPALQLTLGPVAQLVVIVRPAVLAPAIGRQLQEGWPLASAGSLG